MLNFAVNIPLLKYVPVFFFLLILSTLLQAQATDSLSVAKDSVNLEPKELPATNKLTTILAGNSFIDVTSAPEYLIAAERKPSNKSFLFYALAGLVLMLGILKSVFAKYFDTLFRVFFNSSLRQSQLTDQLMQAKLPSMLFNLLFVISFSFYLALLYRYYNLAGSVFSWKIFLISVGVISIMYLVKFITLRFMGWLTGYSEEVDIYTFIIFLINKIVGVLLLPAIIVMAFISSGIASITILLSFILIGLMLIVRFLRSYSLLQSRLKVSRFHFLLYIVALEILPLLLIYKAGVMYVTKSL